MKKSFAECNKCPFYEIDNKKICITNSQQDISSIDYLVITDNIDDWTKIEKSIKNDKKRYLITSPVLCGNTDNKDAINICNANISEIFKICKPKELFLIGPKSKEFEPVMLMIHKFNNLYEFELSRKELNLLSELENNRKEVIAPKIEATKFKNNNEIPKVYMFTIPDKYYTGEYRLVDVQTISSQSRIIYIFRDKNNKKEFYEVPIKEDDFYWYESTSNDNKIIEKYENLQLRLGNYKNRDLSPKSYGGDTNLTTLHCVDYFLQNKEEAPITSKNILHFDIEVYTYKRKIFPRADIAEYPINAISFRHSDSDKTSMYLLKIDKEIDPRIDDLIKSKKYPTMTLFTDEYTMLTAFFQKIQEIQPDFLCGWNSNEFDMPYLVGRMKKLNINPKYFSPFSNVYADVRGRVIITGYIAIDQLDAYKNFSYINLPSYKLDYVANKELGKKKVEFEGDLLSLYSNDIDKFCNYSITDTDLIKELEDVTHHVSIYDELRRITTTSQSGASSTIGQAEGLFLTSMKKKGLIARNTKHSDKEKLPGAYVFDARGGLYNGLLCDFDFQSLYPSIINTWNIGPDTFLAKIDEDIAFDYIYDKNSLKDKKIKIIIDPVHNSKTEIYTLDQLENLIKDNSASINVAGSLFIGHDKYSGIFNTAVSLLFNGRKVYKKKMLECKEKKDKHGEVENYGKQMAYKILANSLYGVLANEHFKFYNNDLAKSITLSGQELLKYCTVHCDNFMQTRKLDSKFKFDAKFMEKVTNLKDVIYGDTDSMFVYLTDFLNELGIKPVKSPEVQKVINTIQDHINNDAINYFLKCHNIDKKRSLIFLKNEYLISKYYTLSGKKHYAARIISQEGKDIELVDVKGLETKRSEIPVRSQQLLNKILDIIMDEKIPKSKILELIDDLVEKERINMLELILKRDNSIVRTANYSTPLQDYKEIPSHVHAMLMWNLLINEDFRYGSRGKLWNIKGIDLSLAPESVKSNYYNKFLKKYSPSDLDNICVPEDVEKLPEWFIPDTKQLIEYCCDSRVNNLLEPLRKKTVLTF